MKKQLVAIALIAGISAGSMFASSISELSTTVKNNGDRDIWVTWKSATTLGKIASSPREIFRQDRYARIKPGKSLEMFHTGDKIGVVTYFNDKPVEQFQNMKTKGYTGANVSTDNGDIKIEEIKK